MVTTSRSGGSPKSRAYSRPNCDGPSYPTLKAALAASKFSFTEPPRRKRQIEEIEPGREAPGEAAGQGRDEIGRLEDGRRQQELVDREHDGPPPPQRLQLLVDEAGSRLDNRDESP